jgi:polar amino acid transport system permease protein
LSFTTLDLLLCFALAAGAVLIAVRIQAGLNYRWEWGVIPQYLLRFDEEQRRWIPNILLQGFFTTIRLSVWGTLLATLIGGCVGLMRTSSRLFNRLIAGTYVELIRNTPPLVLIFIFYFFIGDQILPLFRLEDFLAGTGETTRGVIELLLAPPQKMSSFLSALITLSLFEGAYIAEIVRSGIQSIEKGQWEASDALGMTRLQRMIHVVMPQAVPITLPPLAGQFISTIKDSAIVSVISIPELTFQGMEMMASTYLTFEIWITITVMYLVLTLSCSLAVERLEIRMRK